MRNFYSEYNINLGQLSIKIVKIKSTSNINNFKKYWTDSKIFTIFTGVIYPTLLFILSIVIGNLHSLQLILFILYNLLN